MCGFVTIHHFGVRSGRVDRDELCAIRDHMRRRGPDGAGEWVSSDGRVGMGHRRLSIIDLSDAAAQPMHSADGRYHVVFNGEIYNYRALRRELQSAGCLFSTASDTEVLLHGFVLWGRAVLHRLRGMFAFAVFDERERKLFFARDPFGIKPLYYTKQPGVVRIASQVKALLAGGGVSETPSAAGIVGFHLWGSVPEPHTLYEEIAALPAGSFMTVDERGLFGPVAYESPAQIYGGAEPVSMDDAEAEGAVRAAVKSSVAAHLEADVPVGVFLSAGIDSSVMAGLAAEVHSAPVQTVSLRFEEFHQTENDESALARTTAERYGTRHTTVTIARSEFLELLPDILDVMDQPSIDGINTYLVARAAKQVGLEVAISGLGGDELFGGYPSFVTVPRLRLLFALPARIPGASAGLRNLLGALPLGSRSAKIRSLGQYAGTTAGAYFVKRGLFMPWELPGILGEEIAEEGLRRYDPIADAASKMARGKAFCRIASLEQSLYMRNQLLRDADWAGMAHSLEIRVPLVDAFLARELACIIPGRFSPLHPKRLLASAPRPSLPECLLRRRKTGFSVPMQSWIRDLHPGLSERESWARDWARIVRGEGA